MKYQKYMMLFKVKHYQIKYRKWYIRGKMIQICFFIYSAWAFKAGASTDCLKAAQEEKLRIVPIYLFFKPSEKTLILHQLLGFIRHILMSILK